MLYKNNSKYLCISLSHSLNKEFSVKGLLICLNYFEKLGYEVKAVVPQFRLRMGKSSDPRTLKKLFEAGKIAFTPCKNLPSMANPHVSSYDDRYI